MAVTKSTTVSLLGELFQQGKRPNNLLRLIGGLQGGVRTTTAREFPTNVLYSLRTPGQNVALEGANAPAPETTTITQSTNVVEIHHETVSVTYLAESDKTVGGVVAIPMGAAQGGAPVNPRSTEFQVAMKMQVIQRDVNFSFLKGVYANPGDPSGTALKTRGLLTCVSTNIVDGSADAVATDKAGQYRAYVEAGIAKMVRTNGFSPDLTWTLFADDVEYANICKAYAAKGVQFLMPETTVVGVRVRHIVTDIGTLSLVMEPDMPAQTLLAADLSVVAPVGMQVGDKPLVFMEELAKVGSADNLQIYTQLGIDHGPEFCHSKIILPAITV